LLDVTKRRITDVLISRPPASSNSENYFAWPVWARYLDVSQHPWDARSEFWGQRPTDSGIIWHFDGTKFLEDRDFNLQARINNSLSGFELSAYFGFNVPIKWREPANAGTRARNSGGLWLPLTQTGAAPVNPLFNFVPSETADTNTGLLAHYSVGRKAHDMINNLLFNFYVKKEDNKDFSSGVRIDFLFKLEGDAARDPDLFVARLDAPAASDPAKLKWWTMIRPFSLDIQDVRLQRGGVTILNNVINSNARENVYIRYHLVRPGRVTIQVHTLDGTLVKSIRRNEMRDAGEWVDAWNGTNNGGRPVARGMYFVRVVGPDIDDIRKIMVVK
jgi:hypothetical protein